jgi:hypothetical protein
VSLPAAIGFIALSGIAVMNGVVWMSRALELEAPEAAPREVALNAACERVRAVLMTALVAALGFLPMMLSTGEGAEVQRDRGRWRAPHVDAAHLGRTSRLVPASGRWTPTAKPDVRRVDRTFFACGLEPELSEHLVRFGITSVFLALGARSVLPAGTPRPCRVHRWSRFEGDAPAPAFAPSPHTTSRADGVLVSCNQITL